MEFLEKLNVAKNEMEQAEEKYEDLKQQFDIVVSAYFCCLIRTDLTVPEKVKKYRNYRHAYSYQPGKLTEDWVVIDAADEDDDIYLESRFEIPAEEVFSGNTLAIEERNAKFLAEQKRQQKADEAAKAVAERELYESLKKKFDSPDKEQ